MPDENGEDNSGRLLILLYQMMDTENAICTLSLLRMKKRRRWEDQRADFRIVFKPREEEGEIYYFGIGMRIKKLPKVPDDIWFQIKGRLLPEEEE